MFKSFPIKFSLSTIALLVVIAAVSFGWYVDHLNLTKGSKRPELVGIWEYPGGKNNVLGYSTTLEIRNNGTFQKLVNYRLLRYAYEGEYECHLGGHVIFHATNVQKVVVRGTKEVSNEEKIDEYFYCHCSIDERGFFVIDESGCSGGSEEELYWKGIYSSK